MTIKDALLATIGAEEGGVRGRTLLQKKMYFVSVLVGEDFGFSPHYYGPFSSEVADQLGALCEAVLVVERPEVYPDLIGPFGELHRYDYSLTETGRDVVQRRLHVIQKYAQALEKVNAHAIANDPTLLSIAAKVHFIVGEQGEATSAAIQRRARELGWNITEQQILQVVDYLGHLRLVVTPKAAQSR